MVFEYGRTSDNELLARVVLTQAQLRAIVTVMLFGEVNLQEIAKCQEVRKIFDSPDAFHEAIIEVFSGLEAEELIVHKPGGDENGEDMVINGSHFALHKLSDSKFLDEASAEVSNKQAP